MKIITTLFFLTTLTITAQVKPVTFKAEKRENAIVFTCTNATQATQEVTLTLTEKKGLRGYTRPLIKKVAPKTTMIFATFPIAGAYSYAFTSSWKEMRTPKELEAIATTKKEKVLQDISKINTGIVIFDKTDCARCQRATAYLLDNNINFKLLNITDNATHNTLMWDLLRAQGVTKNVTTPVFLIEGQLTWGHENLDGFLEGLKKS